MGKKKVGIVAAWIMGGCTIFAALLALVGKGCDSKPLKQSLEVKNSPGSNNLQVAGDLKNYYIPEESAERPYLTIELQPGPNEYLAKDGNSQLYALCCYEKSFLIFPIKIRNVGKIHVTKIKAEYSSPDQQNVPIELGEKSSFLAAGEDIRETFRPHVNISNIVQRSDQTEFEVRIMLAYRKYNENDLHEYKSTLQLVLTAGKLVGHEKVYKVKFRPLEFGEQ